MAQPYRVLPGARPLKKQARTARRGPGLVAERKETAASAQPGSAKPVHCTCWWRSQPHSPRQRPTRPRAWGFGSTRSPVTACRRHVAPLMLQFPPCNHVRAAEMSCNRTTRPTPRVAGARTPHPCAPPTPHRTAQERLSDQTQSEDSNCNELIDISTRIHS